MASVERKTSALRSQLSTRLRRASRMRQFRPVNKVSRFLFAFLVATSGGLADEAALPAKIRFNRDVRPILAENCFKCHGFDKKQREAERRLDTREGAVADNEGIIAIAPGNLTESDLHLRIHSLDKDERMPPPKSGKKLSARERAILDRWIEQGAEYRGALGLPASRHVRRCRSSRKAACRCEMRSTRLSRRASRNLGWHRRQKRIDSPSRVVSRSI